MMWIPMEQVPLKQEDAMEVIGYHPAWIDADYNPNGTGIGFIDAEGNFTCARWCGYHDCYETIDGMNDLSDPQIMPTHYMFIPNHP